MNYEDEILDSLEEAEENFYIDEKALKDFKIKNKRNKKNNKEKTNKKRIKLEDKE